MSALQTRPPSDLQLTTIARMCAERGLPMPAVHSSTEASLLIDEIPKREYHPTEQEWDRHERRPSDADAEWLARVRYENGG